MSGDERGTRPPQLLTLLEQSQAFAERLLEENEEGRRRLRALEARCQAAERERDELRRQLEAPARKPSLDGARFRELESELNNLANLHVATWQLHHSLDLAEVATVVVDVCLNLVGTSAVELYLHDERAGRLVRVHGHGRDDGGDIDLHEGGPIAEAAAARRPVVQEGRAPLAVIPLDLPERLVGVVVLHRLLPHKENLAQLDYEFFDLLGRQAATALLSAYLASTRDAEITEQAVRQSMRSS